MKAIVLKIFCGFSRYIPGGKWRVGRMGNCPHRFWKNRRWHRHRVVTAIQMSYWCHRMVDGTKFWISYQRLSFLSNFSCWQLIQNLVPSTIIWRHESKTKLLAKLVKSQILKARQYLNILMSLDVTRKLTKSFHGNNLLCIRLGTAPDSLLKCLRFFFNSNVRSSRSMSKKIWA